MNIKKYLSFFDKVFRMSLCRTFVWRAGPHAGVMIRFAGRRGGQGFRIGRRGVGRVSEMTNFIPGSCREAVGLVAEMTNFIPGSCREAEISGVGVRAVSVSVLAGGVFFGFRRFGLFGRSVLPVNRGPCLYIVRKKTPAYAKTLRFFIRECCICAKIRYICTGLRTISVFVRGDRAGWVFRMVLRSAVLCTLFNPI